MIRSILLTVVLLLSFTAHADSLEEKAELGDARAQVKLAMEYEAGTNRPINIDHAIQWYKQAAMQDNTTAQFNLGQIYKNGYGIAQDSKQAIYWFTRAATQNHPPSQFYLGEIYEYGLAGKVDKNNYHHTNGKANQIDHVGQLSVNFNHARYSWIFTHKTKTNIPITKKECTYEQHI
jgi:hypothetical protein